MIDRQSTGLFCYDQFLLMSNSCRFVDVGCPIWQKAWSVEYKCCCTSQAQSFLGPSPTGFMTIFQRLKFDSPNLEGQIPSFIFSLGKGGPVIPPGTGLPNPRKSKDMLRPTVSQPVCLGVRHSPGADDRFLLLSDCWGFADVQWPLWWEDESIHQKLKSKLCYDRWPVCQSLLV
jgi:hypothetical protein